MKSFFLRLLRAVALAEGTSFLLLLFIAMPLKYMADMPSPVSYVGMAHGYLFVAYVAVVLVAILSGAVGLKRGAIAFFAGFIPFGTFVHDKHLKARQMALA